MSALNICLSKRGKCYFSCFLAVCIFDLFTCACWLRKGKNLNISGIFAKHCTMPLNTSCLNHSLQQLLLPSLFRQGSYFRKINQVATGTVAWFSGFISGPTNFIGCLPIKDSGLVDNSMLHSDHNTSRVEWTSLFGGCWCDLFPKILEWWTSWMCLLLNYLFYV